MSIVAVTTVLDGEMTEYPYTTVPGKIKTLLAKLKTTGVPSKVTVKWLATIGYTSSNDKTLVQVLRAAGLVDQSNTPTKRWSEFRGANSRAVLGSGIREGYAELFKVYPDAHTRSQGDIENVFATSSSAGKQVISKTYSTFKALVDEADFADEHASGTVVIDKGTLHAPAGTPPEKPRAGSSQSTSSPSPSLHIDIQIHISSDASAEQIDQIFASMSKHLYGRVSA